MMCPRCTQLFSSIVCSDHKCPNYDGGACGEFVLKFKELAWNPSAMDMFVELADLYAKMAPEEKNSTTINAHSAWKVGEEGSE